MRKRSPGTLAELRTGESHTSAGYRGGTLVVQRENKCSEMARKTSLKLVNLKIRDYKKQNEMQSQKQWVGEQFEVRY